MCRGFVLQAEDGIRDLVRSRGLGDVYKRQAEGGCAEHRRQRQNLGLGHVVGLHAEFQAPGVCLSLIHI